MLNLFNQKLYWLKKIFQSTSNPLGVFLFRLGFFKECDCKFKQFGIAKLGKNDIKSDLFAALVFSGSQKVSKDGKQIAKNIIKQKNNDILDLGSFRILNMGNKGQYPILFEIFVQEQYFVQDTTAKKVIIDIGGNVGNTALYFANKGYIVYSFEPIKEVFDIAIKNLELNKKFQNQIHFINKAVTKKKGTIKIAYEGLDHSENSSAYLDSGKYIEVEAVTIKDILDNYEIKPWILKMDCEGCEYDIIKNTDLSMFNEIIVEYHSFLTGLKVEILIDELENQGFEVKKLDLISNNNNELGIGFLHGKTRI